MNIAPHAAWKPHTITAIDCASERTGFIGRSVALVIHGVECVLSARTVDDLATVFGSVVGEPLDESRIYKSTMIQSEGVEIVIPEVETSPVVPEVPASSDDAIVPNDEQAPYDPNQPLEIDTDAFMRPENPNGVVKPQMDYDNEEL